MAEGDNVDGEPDVEGEPGGCEVAELSRRHRAHGKLKLLNRNPGFADGPPQETGMTLLLSGNSMADYFSYYRIKFIP